jgi:UPF0716 protein FxsA
MWLFVLFLVVPLVEIALFIQVGGLIGLWPTLAIVVVTAILGTWLVRQQGALALRQIRGSLNELRDPTEPLAHGAMILISGALLLTPGFFTDAVGFALLVPPVRRGAYGWLRRQVEVRRFTYGERQQAPERPAGQPREPDVIDAEFEDLPPRKRPTHRSSGWTRH